MNKKEKRILVIGISIAILFLPTVYILERAPRPCFPKSDNLSEAIIVFRGDIDKPLLKKYGVRKYIKSSYNHSKIKATMPSSCIDDIEREIKVKRLENIIEDEMPSSF
jgi:hypothetical protein